MHRNSRNEEADKAAKQVIDMPGMTATRLLYTYLYCLTIRRAKKKSKCQMEQYLQTSLLSLTLKSRKVPTTIVKNMKLRCVGSVYDRQD